MYNHYIRLFSDLVEIPDLFCLEEAPLAARKNTSIHSTAKKDFDIFNASLCQHKERCADLRTAVSGLRLNVELHKSRPLYRRLRATYQF